MTAHDIAGDASFSRRSIIQLTAAVAVPMPPSNSKRMEMQLVASASRFSAVLADRTTLAAHSERTTAYLSESGREGDFVWSNADLASQVSVDPKQGLYVPPVSDRSGASGAWVRKFSGPVNIKWFGAKGDGSTNDGAAFVAAIAYLKAVASNDAVIYKGSQKLLIPAGHYYLGITTLDITHTLIIEGEGGSGFGSDGGGAPTKLRWAAGTTGIRVQAYNTSGASAVGGSPHSSGAFTTLRDLYLAGPVEDNGSLVSHSLTEGEYHGVHAKSTVYLDNVTVAGFQGDGLYAHTSAGSGGADEGASNASRAYNCSFNSNRNGVSIKGGDANVWVFTACEALFNRGCGFDDQSFLGNTYVGPHTNGNGINNDNDGSANFPAHVVSYSSNRYSVIQGQESGASTNAPSGTTADNMWWYYMGAGAAQAGVPAWSSGIHLRCGAPYRTNNNNASNVFINPYSEGGQGFSQFVYPTIVQGGTAGTGAPKGNGLNIANYMGWFRVGAGGRGAIIDGLTQFNGNGQPIQFLDSVGLGSSAWDGLTGWQHDYKVNGVSKGYALVQTAALYFNHTTAINLRNNGTDIAVVGAKGITFQSAKGPILTETAATSIPSPPAGSQTLFIDTSDHKLKRKDSSGTVTTIA